MGAYSPEELLDESLTSEVCPGDCAHYGSLGSGVCPLPAFTRPATPGSGRPCFRSTEDFSLVS